MAMAHTFLFTLTIIVNSIDLSLESECSHIGERNLGDSCIESSFSARRNSPESSLLPVEPTVRVRSRSPTARHFASSDSPHNSIDSSIRLPSSDGHGCGIEHLESIQLVSLRKPFRVFKLRKYTFPTDKLIKIKIQAKNTYESIQPQEKIVLSTTGSEIFAILETHEVLAGIYKYIDGIMKRVKINMESGTVTKLEPKDIADTPVGARRKLMNYFAVLRNTSFQSQSSTLQIN